MADVTTEWLAAWVMGGAFPAAIEGGNGRIKSIVDRGMSFSGRSTMDL